MRQPFFATSVILYLPVLKPWLHNHGTPLHKVIQHMMAQSDLYQLTWSLLPVLQEIQILGRQRSDARMTIFQPTKDVLGLHQQDQELCDQQLVPWWEEPTCDEHTSCIICFDCRRAYKWTACRHETTALICGRCRHTMLATKRLVQGGDTRAIVTVPCVLCTRRSEIVRCSMTC